MGQPGDQIDWKKLIAAAGLTEVFGDESSAETDCPFCKAAPEDGVQIRLEDDTARCRSCDRATPARTFLKERADLRKRVSPARATELALQTETDDKIVELFNRQPSGPVSLQGPPGHPTPLTLTQIPATDRRSPSGSGRTSPGEILIIGALALACFIAGLMAAGLSGWANHQAFGAMVDDPFQSRVWAWTGVIASICSFGGFTFVYWHFAAGRRKEGLRAIAFALAGAVTSVVGTEMFMANLDMARSTEAAAASARRPVLEAQISDWRDQLAGIPAGTRTVEGLEAYIAEVERVGRSDQKPYRDAKIELGQARRRAELEADIAAARAELLTLGEQTLQPEARRRIPSLFFAVMLEVFASQGTSVGLVALLILLGGGRRMAPA